MTPKTDTVSGPEWEIRTPLITDPLVVKAWIKAVAAVYLVMILILGTVMAGTGEAEGILPLAGVLALVCLGFALAGFLIMALVLGNRYPVRFSLDPRGITCESLDRRTGLASRLAVLAGLLAGSPSGAGAGLLALSRETQLIRWAAVTRVSARPGRHTLVLSNAWRTLLIIHCLPENFEAVRAYVRGQVNPVPPAKGSSPSALGFGLIHTVLVLLSCLPLFAMNDITDLDIFVPLLILCFALATVWLIPLFGWVVMACSVYIPVHLAQALGRYSELKLTQTYGFYRYQTLDAGEWTLLVLALAGLFWLNRVSWLSVKGRFVPVLMRDETGPM